MDPSQPGGNYPGNRPFDGAQGRPTGTPLGYPPAYPQGAPQPYGQQAMQPQYPYMQMKPFSTKAIVAMVMGGVSILFWPVGPVTGLIGAVLGFLGMKESKEPGATHRGWGLALAGLITSGVMFFGSLAMVALFVFVFAMAADEQQRQTTHMDNYDAEADLKLIAERMQLYAVENGNSLQAGGPVVRDGWSSSYGEGSTKVEGRLKLTDLVREMELQRLLSEYTLEVTGRSAATVRNTTTGTTLTVTNAAKEGAWRIDQGSSR